MANPTIHVCGNLVAPPEIRFTQSGVAVASFTVVTSDRRKSQAGEWEDDGEPAFWELADDDDKAVRPDGTDFYTGTVRQAATDVAELRNQLIASQLAAAQVAINTAWNLMPFDTPRLLRERCKQIEGDIIDAADILADIQGEDREVQIEERTTP